MLEPQSRRMSLSTGLRYHFLEWGGDDPTLDHTVVLIHGFLDLSWTWEAVAAAGLAGKYHLVAPDLRGHGDSDRVGAGGYYHFMDYLADLQDLIDQVGRKHVSLVGHSPRGSGRASEVAASVTIRSRKQRPACEPPIPKCRWSWLAESPRFRQCVATMDAISSSTTRCT